MRSIRRHVIPIGPITIGRAERLTIPSDIPAMFLQVTGNRQMTVVGGTHSVVNLKRLKIAVDS